MSRSGYSDDVEDQWSWIMWRGAVSSALRGRRGRKLLQDLIAALDAMPEKRLITEELIDGENVCALGAVGVARGLNLEDIDPYDSVAVADAFDIAPALAQEIVYLNDEWYRPETPEDRWQRMRDWAASALAARETEGGAG